MEALALRRDCRRRHSLLHLDGFGDEPNLEWRSLAARQRAAAIAPGALRGIEGLVGGCQRVLPRRGAVRQRQPVESRPADAAGELAGRAPGAMGVVRAMGRETARPRAHRRRGPRPWSGAWPHRPPRRSPHGSAGSPAPNAAGCRRASPAARHCRRREAGPGGEEACIRSTWQSSSGSGAARAQRSWRSLPETLRQDRGHGCRRAPPSHARNAAGSVSTLVLQSLRHLAAAADRRLPAAHRVSARPPAGQHLAHPAHQVGRKERFL